MIVFSSNQIKSMALVIQINEKAEITNRELMKYMESIKEKKPEDYFWFKDRFNLMKTFREQVWHLKTAAFLLSKRSLKTHEMLDLLKECNKIQSSLLKKLNKA